MMQRTKPECCDCCQFETAELKDYASDVFGPNKSSKWLCFLCASSMAGRYFEYPTVYGEAARIGGLIMNAANQVITEIRKHDSQPSAKGKV